MPDIKTLNWLFSIVILPWWFLSYDLKSEFSKRKLYNFADNTQFTYSVDNRHRLLGANPFISYTSDIECPGPSGQVALVSTCCIWIISGIT